MTTALRQSADLARPWSEMYDQCVAKLASSGGRPRHSGVATDNPRREILAVAARLIAQNGFNATRRAAIAQESGLQQSSIYYWFRSKNEILRAIVDQNRVSLTAARALSGRPEPAAVRLYIVLYQDVVQMCSGPLDFFDLEEAAKKQPDVFSDFRGDYDELVVRLREIVESGTASGQFHRVPAAEFVRTALSLTEGSQHRFRAEGHDISDMPRHRAGDSRGRANRHRRLCRARRQEFVEHRLNRVRRAAHRANVRADYRIQNSVTGPSTRTRPRTNPRGGRNLTATTRT